ncbi:formate dehydrogenase accessory sulfurtransferase FdhD [Massilia consociata]|uniref:Formate dehydrogenase accessory sulfurtransferase FdhD n=1 Tax=Massilia consociata TaxID=760117 RepID=A0ABV6FK89_9BURK
MNNLATHAAMDKKATVSSIAQDRRRRSLTFLQEFLLVAGQSCTGCAGTVVREDFGQAGCSFFFGPDVAVKVAQEAGMTLAGFVRGGRHVLYSHPQRLAPRPP